jgi:hypothetical protein
MTDLKTRIDEFEQALAETVLITRYDALMALETLKMQQEIIRSLEAKVAQLEERLNDR